MQKQKRLNSNTTLVNVKLVLHKNQWIWDYYSNTTLVNVKCNEPSSVRQNCLIQIQHLLMLNTRLIPFTVKSPPHSNTTLVNVKYGAWYAPVRKRGFKYNTC